MFSLFASNLCKKKIDGAAATSSGANAIVSLLGISVFGETVALTKIFPPLEEFVRSQDAERFISHKDRAVSHLIAGHQNHAA